MSDEQISPFEAPPDDPFPFKPKPAGQAPEAAEEENHDSGRALIKFNRLLKHIQDGDEPELRSYIEEVRVLSPDEAENMEHRLNTALENVGPSDDSGAAEDAQETIE
jgi:hypothetical protein